MSNYSKTTDFEAKDSLPTGDSGKIIRGSEFETEFDAISAAIATKADTAGPTFTGTLTFETISDGTINVTAFVDEDNMASNSATLIPTQQSVKAYVDSQLTAQDLDFQADSGGALSIDLDSETMTFTGGTGIDTSGSGNAVTFAIDSTVATLTGSQTLTNKTLTAPTISGNLTTNGTIDGRDVATDGAKLDGIEASADVTDTANVTAAGALMDSELTSIASVKALNQGVATSDSPTFAGLTTTANVSFGDNDKAVFGAGLDLQIYHDGSDSYIQDSGAGDLRLKSNGSGVKIEDAGNTLAFFDTVNNNTKLYHNNNQKLETTGTGIDVTGVITTDGMTTSADINFGDNDKAIFGAGSDLQIYHSGSHSFIEDAGTGNLKIKTNTLRIENAAGTELSATFVQDGAVTLYNDNSIKLATTSTGIDVTGGIAATSDSTFTAASGDIFVTASTSAGSNRSGFRVDETSNNGFEMAHDNADNAFFISRRSGSSTVVDALKIDRNTGDFSLFEDTGTTAKLFFDASAESLGIGTSSPANLLDIVSTSNATARIEGGANGDASLKLTESGNSGVQLKYDGTNNLFAIGGGTSGSFTTHIAVTRDSGSVGIGTDSPGANLQIHDTNSAKLWITADGSNPTNAGSLRLAETQAGGNYFEFLHNGSANTLTLTSTNGDIATFDRTNQRVGIGTNSPSVALEVDGIIKASGNGKLQIADDTEGSTFEFNVGGSGALEILDGSTERMRIDSNGTAIFKGGTQDNAIQIFESGSEIARIGPASGALRFLVGSTTTPRMIIDSNGNFLVGKTSAETTNTVGSEVQADGQIKIAADGKYPLQLNRLTSDGDIINLRKDGTTVGSVSVTSSATTYNTSSDQRLKDNIVDAPSSSDDIDAIQVRSFDWKADGAHQKYGMVAQELLSVAPEAVSQGETEEDMMGVDYSKLVPMMMKEIQSLRARVAQLEGVN